MPSEVTLVNDALSELGKPPISAVNDNPLAAALAYKIAQLHPELLLSDNWIFASVYVEDSTPVSPDYSPDYTYTYQLPPNFGRFFRWSKAMPRQFDYQFADGYLLSYTNPIAYWYIVNDASYAVLPPLYAKALSVYAASQLCLVHTNNAELTAYLEKRYMAHLADAIKYNQTQRPITGAPYNDYSRLQLV